MKKFIKALLLIGLIVVTLGVLAQDKSYDLPRTDYYHAFTFTAADTVSENDSLYYVQLFLNKAEPIKYNIETKITKVDTVVTTVTLQGKVFSTDSWTDITAVSYIGTGTDTTIHYTENTTAKYYRYLRLKHDCDATQAQNYTISTALFKIWDK